MAKMRRVKKRPYVRTCFGGLDFSPLGNQKLSGHIDIVHLRVGKTPSAARTVSVESIHHCREGGWLWDGHDRSEGQWGAVGIVAIIGLTSSPHEMPCTSASDENC